MSLRGTIDEALKNAQKARDAERVSTLRLVRAAIQANDIAGRGEGRKAAGDGEILQILAKMIKQREESASAFEAGKRPELAAKERAEIAVIREFMPKQMDDSEIRAAAEHAIKEIGATIARPGRSSWCDSRDGFRGFRRDGMSSFWTRKRILLGSEEDRE